MSDSAQQADNQMEHTSVVKGVSVHACRAVQHGGQLPLVTGPMRARRGYTGCLCSGARGHLHCPSATRQSMEAVRTHQSVGAAG